MARVWMEGFEDGLPNTDFIQGTLNVSPWADSISAASSNFPTYINLGAGRNAYSLKSLFCANVLADNNQGFIKTFSADLSEFYFRAYIKIKSSASPSGKMNELFSFYDISGNRLFSFYHLSNSGSPLYTNDIDIYAKVGGSYAKQGSTLSGLINSNEWYKIDMYYKVNSSTGAYEIKINDVSVASGSSLNTGTAAVRKAFVGKTLTNANYSLNVDDIALNDTSGSVNNSWCGSGVIVGLKPNGVGNSSQWDTSQGWTVAEDGTSTTNLEITSHGLVTNDIIYNATRDAYRLVTKVDDNNLTVSSITSQAEGDIIVAFQKGSTIAATATTNTSQVTLSGHTLKTYDVFVNTTRSNAIRRVIYVNGNVVYNKLDTTQESGTVTLGSTVTSQAATDSIDCYSVKQYAISDHWKAVSSSSPNPSYSNITSTTINDIDLFDMEELVADKSIPSSAVINAVSVNVMAQENGSGSQYKPVLRSSSTNDEGTTVNLSVSTNHLEYQSVYDESPFTSSAWTISEVDGLEAGVKLV